LWRTGQSIQTLKKFILVRINPSRFKKTTLMLLARINQTKFKKATLPRSILLLCSTPKKIICRLKHLFKLVYKYNVHWVSVSGWIGNYCLKLNYLLLRM
jgi:hypothetical protein